MQINVLPHAHAVLETDKKFVYMQGGIGCVHPDTIIDTINGKVKVRDIKSPTYYLSKTNSGFQYTLGSAPYPKSKGDLYRVKTERGEFVCAGHHLILDSSCKYQRVSDLLESFEQVNLLSTNSEFDQLEFQQDALHYWQTNEDSRDGYQEYNRLCDQQPRSLLSNDQFSFPLQGDVQEFAQSFYLWVLEHLGVFQAQQLKRTLIDQEFYRLSKMDFVHLSEDQLLILANLISSLVFESTSQAVQSSLQSDRNLFFRHTLKSLDSYLAQNISASISPCLTTTYADNKILSITKEVEGVYYDIVIPNTNNYVAEGVVHHNSGKSFTLGDLLVKYRAETVKNEVLLTANTHKQLRDSTLKAITDRLAMYGLDESNYEYQEQKGYFNLEGMKVYMRPLENIDKAIAGLTVDKILCDEYAFIGRPNLKPMYIHNKLIQRLRGKNGINQFVAVSSPNGINFLHDIFVTNKTTEHQFIQCRTKDNTFLPEGYYGSLLAAYGCMDNGAPSDNPEHLTSLAKQELFGEFVNVQENSVYYAFNAKEHVSETISKVAGTVYIGLDFNVEPMCGVAVQFVNNKIHVIDEFVIENNADTYKMVDLLSKRGYRGARIIPDSTGRNRKTSGASDFDILESAGFRIERVHNPIVFDRVNNTNRHFIENSITISSKCKWLIRDLEKVMWRGGKLDQMTDKSLTHISDALGYALWKLNPIGMKPKSYITFE